MLKNISNSFSKFRFWLAIKLIMFSLKIMDKESVEYISFVVAIENWITWLKQIKEESEEE